MLIRCTDRCGGQFSGEDPGMWGFQESTPSPLRFHRTGDKLHRRATAPGLAPQRLELRLRRLGHSSRSCEHLRLDNRSKCRAQRRSPRYRLDGQPRIEPSAIASRQRGRTGMTSRGSDHALHGRIAHVRSHLTVAQERLLGNFPICGFPERMPPRIGPRRCSLLTRCAPTSRDVRGHSFRTFDHESRKTCGPLVHEVLRLGGRRT